MTEIHDTFLCVSEIRPNCASFPLDELNVVMGFPVLTELIGRPGAGKSTAARALSMKTGLTVIERPGQFYKSGGVLGRAWASIKCPVFSFWLYVLVLSRTGRTVDNVRRAYAVQRRYLEIFSRAMDQPTVIDEGPTHGLFSTLLASQSSRLSVVALRKVIEILIAKGMHFVLLDVELETCLERITGVGRSGRFSQNGDQQYWVHLGDNTYEEIIGCIRDHWPERLAVFSRTEDVVSSLDRMRTT